MMDKAAVRVWRDCYDSYTLVGTIADRGDGLSFAYDSTYQGPAISAGLPVSEKPFSVHRTETFFCALAPEGDTRLDFLKILRAGKNEWLPFLKRLGDESSGSLVFSVSNEEPGARESYEALPPDFLERLAAHPAEETFKLTDTTRVSVAGAMRKVGLYRNERLNTWYLTKSCAPTTHIIKMPNEHLFPLETINEAICLTVARLCDIETEEFELIRTESAPILIAKRFDRPLPDSPVFIDGCPRPLRLQQEDLCQLGETTIKYEPSGAHYLSFAARLIHNACINGFGETMGFLCHVFLDYLLGNCDNHLKNFSILYDKDLRTAQLSPAYDILDTTVYARVKTEMGIPLSFNRSIVGVTSNDLREALRHAGFSEKLALGEYESVRDDALRALPRAFDSVAAMGYAKEVERLAPHMERGLKNRASFSYSGTSRTFIDARGLGSDIRK